MPKQEESLSGENWLRPSIRFADRTELPIAMRYDPQLCRSTGPREPPEQLRGAARRAHEGLGGVSAPPRLSLCQEELRGERYYRGCAGFGRGCSPLGVALRELSSPLGSWGVL
jgi:hypothetical protein